MPFPEEGLYPSEGEASELGRKTVKELRDRILAYGFNSRNYTSFINSWIDEAQRNMFRKAGLRIKNTEFEFSSEVGVSSYPLPGDFGKSISLRDLELTSEDTLIRFNTIEEYDDAERTSGTPTNYIINGSRIILYPEPAAVRNYSLRYALVPSAIAEEESSNPSVGEDYYYLLEVYCLYKAFQKENDIEMANHYKQIYDLEMVDFVGDMGTDTKDSPEQVEGAWSGRF